MFQRKSNYYPKDKDFTEISIFFFGSIFNPVDLMCYLKLMALNKKFEIATDSNFILKNALPAYGNNCIYNLRTILDDEEKKKKVRAICSVLLQYGIKTNSIPMIEFISYPRERSCTIYKLSEYLSKKGIRLEELKMENMEELNIEDIDIIEKPKTLEKTRE